MDIAALPIAGAYVITPRQFPDGRGVFLESYRGDRLAEVIGHEPRIVQTNTSVSTAGAVRGIHYADLPPSHAKYVTALSGRFVDYIVDIRVGSPTFGQWTSVELDTLDRRAVYLSEGLGHALACVEDGTVMYLCTAPYTPQREHGVHPLDQQIGLTLPAGCEPVLSVKDSAAPSLAQAQQLGQLPVYADCLAFIASLAGRRD